MPAARVQLRTNELAVKTPHDHFCGAESDVDTTVNPLPCMVASIRWNARMILSWKSHQRLSEVAASDERAQISVCAGSGYNLLKSHI